MNFFALSCSINCQSLSRYLLKMAIQPLVILNTVLYAVYLPYGSEYELVSFRREGPSENIEYCLCPYDKNFITKVGLYFCMFSSPEYPSVESLCFSTVVMQLISVQLFRVTTL